MPKPVADARTRIAEIAVQLVALRDDLRQLAASVPGDEDVFEAEAETEDSLLRSAIECIIADSLEPAIMNLERAAQPRRRAAKP